jgi:hypothetical protein
MLSGIISLREKFCVNRREMALCVAIIWCVDEPDLRSMAQRSSCSLLRSCGESPPSWRTDHRRARSNYARAVWFNLFPKPFVLSRLSVVTAMAAECGPRTLQSSFSSLHRM